MDSLNQTNSGLSTPSPTDKDEEKVTGNGVTIFFMLYYTVVFLFGFIGNIAIIASVYKFKRMRSVVNTFLVNLAIADLLFVLFSIFDAISFLHSGQWVFGDGFCRMQSFSIELSYTVSICTLTVVAAERYMSICHPHKIKRTLKQAINVCVAVWIFSIVFCGCLLYGYAQRFDDDGVKICSNDNWPDKSRLSFYIVHSAVVYLIPLGVMCFSHIFISKALIRQKMRTFSSFSSSSIHITGSAEALENGLSKSRSVSQLKIQKELKRNAKKANKRSKVIRLLVVITTIFFILWTPFMVVRLVKYFGVHVNDLIWRGCQLLVFGNTAINCFVYALMSPAFREAFKGLLCCYQSIRNTTNSMDRSFDLSETMKRQTSITNKSIYRT